MTAARRVLQLLSLCGAAAACSSALAVQDPGIHLRSASRGPAAWVPVGPPPAIVVQFLELYATYAAQPSPKSCTFDEWVGRHGVTDLQRRRWMLALYAWMAHRGHQ